MNLLLLSSFQPLPARLHNAGQQTLVGHIAQGVPAQPKIPVITPGAAGQPATVTMAGPRAVARQLLDFTVDAEFLNRIRRIFKLFFQCRTLGSIFSNQAIALFLALNHGLFSHCV